MCTMNKAARLKNHLTWLFLPLALLLSTDSLAMPNYHIFSEVRGIVVSEGEPVAGARIERTYSWTWKNRKGSDSAVTNAKGEFHLPEITGFALLGWLPHEPVIVQAIRITNRGTTYDAWLYAKRDYDKNGELNGKPMVLYCSLQTPVRRFETGVIGNTAAGICELR